MEDWKQKIYIPKTFFMLADLDRRIKQMKREDDYTRIKLKLDAVFLALKEDE